MGSLWLILAKPKNRAVLSWIGSGLVVVAAGIWAVVTYVWPHESTHEGPKVVCAQQGSVAAGGNASGNTITFSGSVAAGGEVVSCADAAKKQ
ncbi:hypothetical protein SAMN05519103_00702 [Rhizobiales bacterium GAS113]|nr:hypothetical protein SAMN05519103_00702 [Rhizobiales bacterium GAS113]